MSSSDQYYDRRQPYPQQQLPPNGQSKTTSYRRAADIPPQQYDSPVIPSYPPSSNPNNLTQPQVYPSNATQNGTSRSNSHRRRESRGYAPPSGIPAPEASQVPGGGYGRNSASYPAGAIVAGPPIDTSYGGEDASKRRSSRREGQVKVNTAIPAPSYAGDNGAMTGQTPVSPTSGGMSRDASTATSSTRRRSSVTDRSPLQRLEGHLESISKEERRARVEEAELMARRKSEARQQQRRVSGPERQIPLSQGPERRNVTAPAQVEEGHFRPARATVDVAPTGVTFAKGVIQPETGAQWDSQRGKEKARYSSGPPAPILKEQRQQQAPVVIQKPERMEQAPHATGLGLQYDGTPAGTAPPERTDWAQRQPSIGRSNSKKLQKSPPRSNSKSTGNKDAGKMGTAGTQMQEERMGHGRHEDRKAARQNLDPDPIPPEAVQAHHARGPKYEIPPQTAAGQQVREQVGFGAHEPDEGIPGHEGHTHMFHRSHDDARRYISPEPLDEWRNAPKVSLMGKDLLIDEPAPAPAPAAAAAPAKDNQAWWEKPKSRRSSGSAQQQQPQTSNFPYDYDGPAEDSNGQTLFKPRLYLKCGPLLRYCGIRREAGGREIWRGTIMIVTVDRHSEYSSSPFLRLFVQPRELIPPPPAKVSDGLAQEYVDPLAGHIKTGRNGETLYVRPIEDIDPEVDLSRVEDNTGLFEINRSAPLTQHEQRQRGHRRRDGEKAGKFREVRAHRLHTERGVTFWRFNLEVELGKEQERIAYRINRGPAIGFWVPARGQTMNIMFHSCNGFSLSVESDKFSGPDPMWRNVLDNHLFKPFHVMLGGGDQIYNDAAMKQTDLFQEWLGMKNPYEKHSTPFSIEMQDELEEFYLERYCMWFSQGLFGMANSMIPMVNMWDDHDIIDGFGSYPHHFMSTPVFSGLGAIAFKYYMLFQHQSVPTETHVDEPSWLLGAERGPYINQLSRSVFTSLGRHVAFLALDCRMERMRDSILSQGSYDLIFDRLRREIIEGETKHLIVLLGVPIAYPRLNFLENVLTSRVMDPIKALGRAGMLGNFVNKFDGGVEILDDLDDHWTAKHHKGERNWFIQELQFLAADKSVRVTILGGDVHLGAIGQFYSNRKLGIPKDRDHRYMPNVISSAIVNTPPPELMADVLNKRNKIHHLDHDTDEDMIPMFTHDVDNKPRNNRHLLPRRNWCAIREYEPGQTPPPTPPLSPSIAAQSDRGRGESRERPTGVRRRSLSLSRKDFTPGALVRRLSGRGGERPDIGRRDSRRETGPPVSYYNRTPQTAGGHRRAASEEVITRPEDNNSSYFPPILPSHDPPRPNPFHRTPTGLSEKAARKGGGVNAGPVDLQNGLDVVLNFEVSQKDPAGITTPYRLLIPALYYDGPADPNVTRREGRIKSMIGSITGRRKSKVPYSEEDVHHSYTGTDHSYDETPLSMQSTPAERYRSSSDGAADERYNRSYDDVYDKHAQATRRQSEAKRYVPPTAPVVPVAPTGPLPAPAPAAAPVQQPQRQSFSMRGTGRVSTEVPMGQSAFSSNQTTRQAPPPATTYTTTTTTYTAPVVTTTTYAPPPQLISYNQTSSLPSRHPSTRMSADVPRGEVGRGPYTVPVRRSGRWEGHPGYEDDDYDTEASLTPTQSVQGERERHYVEEKPREKKKAGWKIWR